MRILRIAQEMPYPANNGGRIETYHSTKQLARLGHEIVLMAFQGDEEDTTPLNEICEVHPILFNGKNSLKNIFKGIAAGIPVNYVKWQDQKMLAACLAILKTKPFDIIVVEYSALGWYVSELRRHTNIPIVMRFHNLDTLIWRRWTKSQRNPLKRIVGRRQEQCVERAERKLAERSDASITIGAHDSELLKAMAPRANIRFVPAGVDTDYYAPSSALEDEASLLFLGSHYRWHPNWDAVKWLYREIMPLVWKRIPRARVYITGKDAPAEMAAWGRDERVILTGFVRDERTVIARTTIMVLPMRLGGGIKLKLLTAMASGKAMVSTTAGAEGAPAVVDGEHLLLRDETEPFAQAITDLIENADLRRKIANNARSYVCEHFDWRVIGLQWDKVLREAYDRRATHFPAPPGSAL